MAGNMNNRLEVLFKAILPCENHPEFKGFQATIYTDTLNRVFLTFASKTQTIRVTLEEEYLVRHPNQE